MVLKYAPSHATTMALATPPYSRLIPMASLCVECLGNVV